MPAETPSKRSRSRTSLSDTVKNAASARQAVESDAEVVHATAPDPKSANPAEQAPAAHGAPVANETVAAAETAVACAPAKCRATAGRVALGATGGVIGAAGLQALLGAGLFTFGGGLALGIFAGLASADRYLKGRRGAGA